MKALRGVSRVYFDQKNYPQAIIRKLAFWRIWEMLTVFKPSTIKLLRGIMTKRSRLISKRSKSTEKLGIVDES
jgi:hypothetical protein